VAPTIVPTGSAAPGGDGYALRVMDPAGGTDSVRLSAGQVSDCAVQATLYCDYRPGLAGDGFERIGVFTRDLGGGAFDGTQSQAGACYALAWDSHDGRLWCMRALAGSLTDLNPRPIHLPGTAWRTFRIEARGPELTFLVDGYRVLRTLDTIFPRGEFGIGYHEYFATNANMRGTRADRFHADVLDGFAMDMHAGPGAGTLVVDRARGIPEQLYLTAVTARRGAFPAGSFFGIDIGLGELVTLLGTGSPAFVGRLDSAGTADVVLSGVPAGLPLYGVSLTLDPGFAVSGVTAPVEFVTR
jgi:hypothetical protein